MFYFQILFLHGSAIVNYGPSYSKVLMIVIIILIIIELWTDTCISQCPVSRTELKLHKNIASLDNIVSSQQ